MVDWISISQNSGSGNTTITVTASSYSELLERSTSLTVRTPTRSAVVGITQTYNSSFDVIPSQLVDVPASGGVYTITVVSDDVWYITGEVGVYDVFSASPNSGGTGTTNVTVTISANTGTSRNTYIRVMQGTIFDTGKPFREISIIQNGSGATEDSFYFNPHYARMTPEQHTIGFAVISDGSWTLTAPEWVTLSSYSGTGDNHSLYMTVTQNDGADRTGSIVGFINGSRKDSILLAQTGYNSNS